MVSELITNVEVFICLSEVGLKPMQFEFATCTSVLNMQR